MNTQTLTATDDPTPGTWEAAAALCLVEILARYRCVTDLAGMERELQALKRASFDNDHSPTPYLEWMACYSRDALTRSSLMPTAEEIVDLLASKQANYGTGNILAFGQKGVIIRVSDKVARIDNMLARDRTVDLDEPLEDAYIDIIGYAVISLMLERDWFKLPLARDLAELEAVDTIGDIRSWNAVSEARRRHPSYIPADSPTAIEHVPAQAIQAVVTDPHHVIVAYLIIRP